jgi:hypothetical protein
MTRGGSTGHRRGHDALGADRCEELLERGAAMEEHDAVALARDAARRVLSAEVVDPR